VIAYAIVDSRDEPGQHPFGDVLDVYLDREAAEKELRDIVGDEPAWKPYFSLIAIELESGCAN